MTSLSHSEPETGYLVINLVLVLESGLTMFSYSSVPSERQVLPGGPAAGPGLRLAGAGGSGSDRRLLPQQVPPADAAEPEGVRGAAAGVPPVPTAEAGHTPEHTPGHTPGGEPRGTHTHLNTHLNTHLDTHLEESQEVHTHISTHT